MQATRTIALILSLQAMSIAQQVLVVGSASSPFPDMQSAVDAAQAGDTVLVKPGSHFSFVSIDRGISLVADGLVSCGAIGIQNIPAGERVVIQGFGASTVAAAFFIDNCAGEVWIEDSVRTNAFFGGTSITNCSSVTFLRVESGVHCQQSNFYAFGSTFEDLSGGGATFTDSVAYMQRTTCTGARGFNDRGFCTDGGPGVHLIGTSTVTAVDCQFVGGLPSASGLPCQNPVSAGPATLVEPTATLTQIARGPLDFQAPALAREGQPIDYVIDGLPGDQPVLALSFDAQPIYFPLITAPLLVGPGIAAIPVGVIPQSGTLGIATTAPTLPAGELIQRYFVQVLALRRSGILFGGPARTVTTLDSSLTE